MVVVPQKRLTERPGERISHPDLPVDVEVLKYMKNADCRRDPEAGRGQPRDRRRRAAS